MKTQFFALTVAAVAVSSFAVPAHAFSFGTDGIKFDLDTKVDFSFVESHGAYTSALSIFEKSNLAAPVAALFHETKASDNQWRNEWKGTFGNAVTSATGANKVSFLFKAGVDYTLGLVSGNAGTVYSTNSLNTQSGGSQQAVFANVSTIAQLVGGGRPFAGSSTSFTSGNPFAAGGLAISFDDRGNANDADFQDFTVRAEAVPEPLTLGGIALAGAGMTFVRRRRQQANG